MADKKKADDKKAAPEDAPVAAPPAALTHAPDYVEFPKHVVRGGVTREFASRAAQDAAGPEWAD